MLSLEMPAADEKRRLEELEQKEGRVRTLMAVGIASTFLGLAIAATFDKMVGGALSVFGWGVLAYTVHRLGRLGGR